MKQTLIYLLIATLAISCCSCKKSTTTEDQLPPETTTGAMTFGCKIDGKVFVPKDGNGKPGLYAQYIFLGNGPGGGWYLNIPAIDWTLNEIPGVSITTDSLLVKEGLIYPLKKVKGCAKAFYVNASQYNTQTDSSGVLKIIKFDPINHILSGTFSFTGTNSISAKIYVTDGRFDITY